MLDRFFETVSKFFKLIIFGMIILGLVYLGMTIYANLRTDPGEFKVPAASKAQYEFLIRNTRNVIYSDEYETEGATFILHGYWELVDNKFKYRDIDIPLNQDIFGTITVRRR